MKFVAHFRIACTVLLLACGPALVQGQHGGGGMGGGPRGGGGMGMPGGGGMRGGMPHDGHGPGGAGGNIRGGATMGPPGRWWDDKKFARSLGLNGDQQKRMDSVFSQNRDALQSRLENLQKAEGRLDDLKRSNHPNETALSTEIDHVAQARADLEKTYTHMLLQIRDEMTSDQINRLEESR